jgi:hypothetical protein
MCPSDRKAGWGQAPSWPTAPPHPPHGTSGPTWGLRTSRRNLYIVVTLPLNMQETYAFEGAFCTFNTHTNLDCLVTDTYYWLVTRIEPSGAVWCYTTNTNGDTIYNK